MPEVVVAVRCQEVAAASARCSVECLSLARGDVTTVIGT